MLIQIRLFFLIFSLLCATTVNATAKDSPPVSTCYGTTSHGRLDAGVKLPRSGTNFVTYSDVARMAGRTFVHSQVAEILLDTWKALETEMPGKMYKYAETGFAEGGPFAPHKTHQNGLSVDFMTPVINKEGESVHLPTYPWTRFGYDLEFDQQGRLGDLTIDYDALAAHIVMLDRTAKAMGVGLWRVIFAPELQAGLFATRYGDYIRSNIQLSTRRSWVRHDEHYHVDFDIPCQK